MPAFPPEILEKVFAHLSGRDLTSVALTSRLCYYLSLVLLYRRICHIQLFGWNGQAHVPSIKCLESLSSPGNGSQAVRHFSARGHPWLKEVTMETLCKALVQMKSLVSIELEMGTLPEELIFTESQCSLPSFLPHLRAVSLHDHTSAANLLAGRPVENLHIKSVLDITMFLELLTPLQLSSTPLKSLQIWVSVPDVTSAVTIVDHLARFLPSLVTLGITFTFPTPHWTESLSVTVEEIINPLTHLKCLVEFGLAMIPDLPSPGRTDSHLSDSRACSDTINRYMPHLRIIEVQWEAYQLRDGNLEPLSKHHPLMRRKWRCHLVTHS